MKNFLPISLFLVAVAASEFIPEEDRVAGENGWYIPRINNKTEWVNMDDAEAELEMLRNQTNVGKLDVVTFFLYTRKNPKDPQRITPDNASIKASNYNISHSTRVCIHGWQSGKGGFINVGVRDAWLGKDEYNYIFVEWEAAWDFNYAISYLYTELASIRLYKLLRFLVENFSLNLLDLTIAGHSLGAHIAGFSARRFYPTQVHIVVGLDPALPYFHYDNPNTRLSSNDAFYVEVIHTNGGWLGFLRPIGDGDFYPNGGQKQPSCSIIDIINICDHSAANYYYAEAIKLDDFTTLVCVSYEQAVDKSCNDECCEYRMGAVYEDDLVNGIYYVPVNADEPYGVLCHY